MSNYGISYDDFVSVEEQARSDIRRGLRAAVMVLKFLAPIIIGAAAIFMAEIYGQTYPILAVAGTVSAIATSHVFLAIVRFFGRNEENQWKRDFGRAWFVWTKWTAWTSVCGIATCALMLVDVGAGSTIAMTVAEVQGFILGIIG